MRFLVLGAGAVGSLTGAFLQRQGHEVLYVVRSDASGAHARLRVKRVDKPEEFLSEPRTILRAGDTLPDYDHVLVCVRGDQIEEAVSQAVRFLRTDVPWGLGAATLEESVSLVRTEGVTGPVYTYHVGFGAWFSCPEVLHWFPFKGGSLASAEGNKESLPAARQFATAIADSGLPCKPTLSFRKIFRLLVAAQCAQLAGWDLCGWDLDRLAQDQKVRALTAQGMKEALRAVGPGSGVPGFFASRLPQRAWHLLLGQLPRRVGPAGKEVWRVHGPKIRGQCLATLLELEHKLAEQGLPSAALTELRSSVAGLQQS